MMLHRRISRVDIQVSILTACIVIISCGAIYLLSYSITYHEMIGSLQERVKGIYHYMEDNLSADSFRDINTPGDETSPLYLKTKAVLETVRNTTGVRYLYTAKRAEDGRYVYLVDGLPSDSEDFRNVGDAIEEEIIPDIRSALEGAIVLPDEIKNTSWGYIFISYMPIRSGDQVIGVVGIEFAAERQYQAFQQLKTVTPVVIFFSCVIAAAAAVVLFRRLSNPSYQDYANTDMLTGLKNRNAFETDFHNLSAESGIGFVVVDLDQLKHVNDTWGHQAGDRYITSASRFLKKCVGEKHAVYRTGGDEFAAIFRQADEKSLAVLIQRIQEGAGVGAPEVTGEPVPKLSAGFSVYSQETDKDLNETLKRADDMMYENKRLRRLAGKADPA